MGTPADLTGKVFGRLTVIGRGERLHGELAWLTQCTCGKQKLVRAYDLRHNTRSCGCLSVDKVIERSTQHGLTKSAEHRAWNAMLDRCSNERNNQYHNYGGRGIKVCERWLEFVNFYADLGPRPEGMSLERIDVNGNYEPSNCKWASFEEQSNNKRGMKKYLVDGEWRTLTQLARYWNVGKQKAQKQAGQYESKIVGEEK